MAPRTAKNQEETLSKQTMTTKKKDCETSCAMQETSTKKTKSSKNPARIVIHYDCGVPNTLYLRGNGGKLNWEKGVPMENQGPNTWVWECNADFENCEFKVLLNDQVYESGSNHCIKKGCSCEYTPYFDYT